MGIAQGIFLIIALLSSKKKRRISIYLIVSIILCFLFLILFELLKNSLTLDQILTMFSVGGTIPLLIGPLFLLYVMSVMHLDFKITRPLLLHFLPFAIFLVYFSTSALGITENRIGMEVFSILKGVHTLIYFIFSYIFLKKNAAISKKGVKSWYNSKILLRLILVQISAILIIYAIVVFEVFYPDVNIESDRISSLLLTLFFFAFSFVLILYPNETIPDKLSKKQYLYSSLKDINKKEILSSVLKLLDEEKLFLNPELNLNELSELLNVNSSHVSQVINELLGKNFNQLINEYRVAEVKRNLLDYKRTLLGIAYDSGFNSKSTFNRIFKEIEGETPSEYKKNLQNKS